MRVIHRISAVLVCLLFLPVGQARAAWSPDSFVTVKTKLSLLAARGVRAQEVHVQTTEGIVTIHGKVSDEEQRARAEEVAWGVKGVKDVRNLLQVVPPFFREMVDVTDAVIRMRVERALEEDRMLEGSDVRVVSVNNGVVLLTGEARTMSDYLVAIDDVASVPGVRGIGSDVESPDLIGEMLGAPGDRDGAGSRDLSGAADDLWITAATKLRLLADPEVPGMAVDVDAWDGVVTLFGSVPSREAKEAAGEAARSVKGVERVENEIVVTPEEYRELTRARDAFLAREVKLALGAAEPPKGSVIRVKANGGVVRLTGTVPSEEHRLLALVAAHAIPGVRAVEEDLRVNHSATRY